MASCIKFHLGCIPELKGGLPFALDLEAKKESSRQYHTSPFWLQNYLKGLSQPDRRTIDQAAITFKWSSSLGIGIYKEIWRLVPKVSLELIVGGADQR